MRFGYIFVKAHKRKHRGKTHAVKSHRRKHHASRKNFSGAQKMIGLHPVKWHRITHI